MTDTAPELLPCPFCGGDNIGTLTIRPEHALAHCTDCGAGNGLARWNTRANLADYERRTRSAIEFSCTPTNLDNNGTASGSQQGAECDVERDAARYRWLRARDLDTIQQGGVFAGLTPDNMILNGADLDEAVDAAMGGTE